MKKKELLIIHAFYNERAFTAKYSKEVLMLDNSSWAEDDFLFVTGLFKTVLQWSCSISAEFVLDLPHAEVTQRFCCSCVFAGLSLWNLPCYKCSVHKTAVERSAVLRGRSQDALLLLNCCSVHTCIRRRSLSIISHSFLMSHFLHLSKKVYCASLGSSVWFPSVANKYSLGFGHGVLPSLQ